MIVAIDGPAGAGKSSVSRKLAERLGFAFLDTGAMYRCVTLAVMRSGIAWDDQDQVARKAHEVNIEMDNGRVWLDGQDVGNDIRTREVTSNIRYVAGNRQVRIRMIELQRAWALGRNLVTEGRDQATEAFPHAECKIFLTASPEERARRRTAELIADGVQVSYEEILQQQTRRDQEDSQREFGALRAAEDAIIFHTDGLSHDQVVDELEKIVLSKQSEASIRHG